MAILNGMLRRHVIVGILGARQVGKSTLARMVARTRRGPVTFFDLEKDEDLARLSDPMLALKGLGGAGDHRRYSSSLGALACYNT